MSHAQGQNAAHGGFVEQNEFVVGKIRNFLTDSWPGYDYRIKRLDEFASRSISREEALNEWLEGERRLMAIFALRDYILDTDTMK
jgi:hypothetical protein